MSVNLQEQPESTLGHRPTELGAHPAGEHPAAPEAAEKPEDQERFARARARREEAEEASEVGSEVRDHDPHLDARPLPIGDPDI